MADNEFLEGVDCPECGQELDATMTGAYPTMAGGTAQVQTEWITLCKNPDCSRNKCRECGAVLNVSEVGVSTASGERVMKRSIVCSNPDCPTNDSDLAPAASQP